MFFTAIIGSVRIELRKKRQCVSFKHRAASGGLNKGALHDASSCMKACLAAINTKTSAKPIDLVAVRASGPREPSSVASSRRTYALRKAESLGAATSGDFVARRTASLTNSHVVAGRSRQPLGGSASDGSPFEIGEKMSGHQFAHFRRGPAWRCQEPIWPTDGPDVGQMPPVDWFRHCEDQPSARCHDAARTAPRIEYPILPAFENQQDRLSANWRRVRPTARGIGARSRPRIRHSQTLSPCRGKPYQTESEASRALTVSSLRYVLARQPADGGGRPLPGEQETEYMKRTLHRRARPRAKSGQCLNRSCDNRVTSLSSRRALKSGCCESISSNVRRRSAPRRCSLQNAVRCLSSSLRSGCLAALCRSSASRPASYRLTPAEIDRLSTRYLKKRPRSHRSAGVLRRVFISFTTNASR